MSDNASTAGDETTSPPRETRGARLLKHATDIVNSPQYLAQMAQANAPGALDPAQLLEELRIYQVELEVQNEELRHAQQATELARARYQALFSQIPIPALVLDSKGVVQRTNERAEALLGKRQPFETLDNRLVRGLSHEDRARMHVALRDLGQEEDPVLSGVHWGSGATAARYDIHLIRLSSVYHLDHHIFALMVDRTAESARAQEQHFFSCFLDSTQDFVFAADAQGRMLLANQPLLSFLGLDRDQVVGHVREEFLPLRDALNHRNADQQVLHSGLPLTVDEQVHDVNGVSRREFLTHKFLLQDVQGNISGVGGISSDVTAANEQTRQALLSEAVFTAASEGILIADAQTRIVRVNPAFCKLSGFSQDTLVGHKVSTLKSGRHSDEFYQQMWQSLNDKGHWAGEMLDRSADGRIYPLWNSINVIRDTSGQVVYYVSVQTDLTPLLEAKSQIQNMASFDSLTGLPNRSLFNDRLNQLLAQAKRHHRSFAVMFMDLDYFKEVNDTLGHQMGDELLKAVAKRLQQALRSEDTVARIGGDEFVILMPAVNRSGAETAVSKLLDQLRAPMHLGEVVDYQPMASLGMAMYPEDGSTADTLLRNADTAMYDAKAAGRNRGVTYTAKMGEASASAFSIQNDLTTGIARGELRVFYQPKFSLRTGLLTGAEALVRWERPGHGLVSPAVFIPIAERSGLIIAVDQWVFQETLRQVSEWQQQGLWPASLCMALNQSAADLRHPGMVEDLRKLLMHHSLTGALLEVEITEGALLEHTEEIIEKLKDLRSLGLSLAIDDFGTGFSSLAYLRNLPISVIKIDQGFVRGMLSNDNDRVLVETIVSMAHNLGLQLVAEGVETPEQRDRLAELGCEIGQGYFFGRPVPADEFARAYLG